MSTNPTTPGIADFLPAGPIDEEKLVRATYQTINKQYDPDKSIAEIFHSIQCSIDDPRADGRIDEAGREVVLYACTVTLRRNKGCD